MPEAEKAATCVKVALRCRPLVGKELTDGCQPCLVCVPGENQVVLGKDKAFTYDFSFGPNDPQGAVYDRAVLPLVKSLFKGFNATVLAYGQTGSGKTFTMGSSYSALPPSGAGGDKCNSAADQQELGVIPRVVDDLFAMQSSRLDYEFSTKVSFLEIYNEELTDLLSPRVSAQEDAVSVREDAGGGIRIVGLTEVTVASARETLALLERGSQGRTTASTNMNATSSRSHAIFTVHVEQKKKDDVNDLCRAKFHLVDLAGSERAKRTGAEGSRFKEGVNINLGLLALGNVISALGDESQKRSHVPYRDSKLTRLLQDSLGGNSVTLMIACVSPADSNMEETLNTLRYADRARKIKNKPVVNRDPHVAELLALRQLVQQLQAASGVARGNCPSVTGGDALFGTLDCGGRDIATSKWEQMYRDLEEENRKLGAELQGAIDQSTELCEKVILAEVARDKLKAKLEQLRLDTGLTMDELEDSLNDPTVSPELKEKLIKVKDIQTRLSKLEGETCLADSLSTILEAEEAASAADSCVAGSVAFGDGTLAASTSPSSGRGSADDCEADGGAEHFARSYAQQRVKMSRELQQLNSLLDKKQELAVQMVSNNERTHETERRQLVEAERRVAELQRERDALLEHTQPQLPVRLQSAEGGNGAGAAGKLSEQRRQRLKELEAQIEEQRKKITELARVARMKEQVDKKVVTLGGEIDDLKRQRVRLMRQMKDDGEVFRRWKQDKNKEVLQLKAVDRRRQCEMVRLERQSKLTQSFYRRKAEEAAVANKRLKDALERQKSAATDRERSRLGTTDSTQELSGIGPRVKAYINDEVEMQVSLRDAERHLEQQIADRRTLNEQLLRLKSKPVMTGESRDSNGALIKSLTAEITLSNVQIADLQQKIVDAKSSKSTTAAERVQTMVEAKCAIRHLVSMVVGSKLAETVSVSRNKELNTTYEESTKQIERLETELVDLRQFHANEVMSLQKEHEERALLLLHQLSSHASSAATPGAAAGDKETEKFKNFVQIQAEEISQLKKIECDHRRIVEENEQLRRDLVVANYKKGSGGLMPLIPVEDSPYLNRCPKTRVTVIASSSEEDRKGFVTKLSLKMNSSGDATVARDDNDNSSDEEDDEEEEEEDYHDESWRADDVDTGAEDAETPARCPKRRKLALPNVCNCKTDCSKRLCSCQKKGLRCGDTCKCSAAKCVNRRDGDDAAKENKVPLVDKRASSKRASSDADKLADSSGASATLNSTFILDSSDLERKRSDHNEAGKDAAGIAKKPRLLTRKDRASFFDAPGF